MMEEPGRLQPMGSQESDMTWQLNPYDTELYPALCYNLEWGWGGVEGRRLGRRGHMYTDG